jgi:hypothetical protein
MTVVVELVGHAPVEILRFAQDDTAFVGLNPGICTGVGVDWRGDCTYARRGIARSRTSSKPQRKSRR